MLKCDEIDAMPSVVDHECSKAKIFLLELQMKRRLRKETWCIKKALFSIVPAIDSATMYLSVVRNLLK